MQFIEIGNVSFSMDDVVAVAYAEDGGNFVATVYLRGGHTLGSLNCNTKEAQSLFKFIPSRKKKINISPNLLERI